MNNNNLSNFTDILSDEIGDSQPMSLPSSCKSDSSNIVNNDMVIQKTNKPAKCTGQLGSFRNRAEIDEKYRDVFTHEYFNLVQSRVIDDALYTDKSLVICAPTGSGKTVIFEMAIVQLLMNMEYRNINRDFKIIYMAPVKALCTERLTEWYPKFTKLGLLCIEVTGDTDVEFPQLKPYSLIITTPEKWDMLTRRWRDNRGLVEVTKLFLIDEVHILNDETRGPVLEAVVSRMKTIESSAQSDHRIEKLQREYQNTASTSTESAAPRIRFVAVSATISNPEDVAVWLGTGDRPAVYYKFEDECRPVKLKLVVEGYPCAVGASLFKFDIVLNYKLWPVIQKYYNGKPTLIFCNTRKSVVLTAETLSREITVGFNGEQKTRLAALASTIRNKKIQTLILSGVGCHHAGLLFEERTHIENAFRNRDLPILITTTTLAMGVNLPAHLVIIKNTQQYVNGAYQEYSASTILQMVGRAGRPQYDTEATAVIMTRATDKARYQSVVGGSEPLQSYLHKRLAENLNSEAALGTVCDVAQCVQWLNSTFLNVRAARDPRRYLGLPQNASKQLISKKIEELCVKAMNSLASSGLITMDEACCIQSTEAGHLMSVYYIDVETMKNIMKMSGTETLESVLWVVCGSHELSDMHLRMDERRCLNALNRNNAAAAIRYPMKGKINTRQMKLNCMIQAVLGCLPIPEPSLNQEAMKIMRIAARVCKCLVAYVTGTFTNNNSTTYSTVLNSIFLNKCISSQLWENSPYLSKQLKGIGPTFSSLLASVGKINFMLLEESHPRDLERIMNKGPPAGNVLRKQISLLPKYRLTLIPSDINSVKIELTLLNHAYLLENVEHLTAGGNHKFYLIVGDSDNNLLHISSYKDKDLISVYDGHITCNVSRRLNTEHKLKAHCISSNFVGIDEHCEFVFKDMFPTINVNCTKATNASSETATNNMNKGNKKRKCVSEEITQPKEKKKRQSIIITKFQNLKDYFSATSSRIQNELNESRELSNNILDNYQPKCALQNNTSNVSANNKEYAVLATDDIPYKSLDSCINDTEINNILDDIENEIKDQNKVNLANDKKNPHIETSKVCNLQKDYKHNEQKYTNYLPQNKAKMGYTNVIKNIKHKNMKFDYNFIDLVEDKREIQNDSIIVNQGGGLSNAVKNSINCFLEKLQINNKSENSLPDILNSPQPFMANDSNINNIKMDTADIYEDKRISLKCSILNCNSNENINNNKFIKPAVSPDSGHMSYLKANYDSSLSNKMIPKIKISSSDSELEPDSLEELLPIKNIDNSIQSKQKEENGKDYDVLGKVETVQYKSTNQLHTKDFSIMSQNKYPLAKINSVSNDKIYKKADSQPQMELNKPLESSGVINNVVQNIWKMYNASEQFDDAINLYGSNTGKPLLNSGNYYGKLVNSEITTPSLEIDPSKNKLALTDDSEKKGKLVNSEITIPTLEIDSSKNKLSLTDDSQKKGKLVNSDITAPTLEIDPSKNKLALTDDSEKKGKLVNSEITIPTLEIDSSKNKLSLTDDSQKKGKLVNSDITAPTLEIDPSKNKLALTDDSEKKGKLVNSEITAPTLEIDPSKNKLALTDDSEKKGKLVNSEITISTLEIDSSKNKLSLTDDSQKKGKLDNSEITAPTLEIDTSKIKLSLTDASKEKKKPASDDIKERLCQNLRNLEKLFKSTRPEQSNSKKTKNETQKEYVNNFSFSATQINAQTHFSQERHISIISKVQIDLNIKEINTTRGSAETPDNCTTVDRLNVENNKSNMFKTEIQHGDGEKNIELEHVPQKKEFDNSNKSTEIDENGSKNANNADITSLDTILRKYKDILSRKNNTNELRLSNLNSKNIGIKSSTCTGNPKQYKISDLHRINIPLPETLISATGNCNKDDNSIKKRLNEYYKITQTSEEVIDVSETEPIDPIADNSNDDIEICSTSINDINEEDYDIAHEMLNPKTLLQSAQANLEVIPPPHEFSDAYSPIPNYQYPITNFDAVNEIDFDVPRYSVLPEMNNFEHEPYNVTVSNDLETWTLSQDDRDFTVYSNNPNQNATTTRTDNFTTENMSQSSTQSKLKTFQFTPKPNLYH